MASNMMPLTISADDGNWSFIAGPWQTGAQQIMTPPIDWADENLAIYSACAYGDFEAEYEFRWEITWTDAGFVFRAGDAQHFYLVNFPVVGQQYRAEHFRAAISKVDESGYVQVLKMEMMHGVTSAPLVWHHARIKVQGNEIRLWVDGRPLSVVVDNTYTKPGYVGLYSYSSLGASEKSSFRNLRIRGEPVKAAPWNDRIKPQHHYSVVCEGKEVGGGCGNIVRTLNGDILAGGVLRSGDNGRSWSGPHTLPQGIGGMFYVTEDGLLTVHGLCDEPPFLLQRATSADNGRTWSAPMVTGEVVFDPQRPYKQLYASDLLKLADGSLLLFAWGRTIHERTVIDGRIYYEGPVPHDISICLRSTDEGRSWSPPVMVDGPPYDEANWMAYKDAVSEVSAAQTLDGKIITLTRPYTSPFMWESWSSDGGRTWTPQTRGPFALYGCAMVSTSSGYLLISGRFPPSRCKSAATTA